MRFVRFFRTSSASTDAGDESAQRGVARAERAGEAYLRLGRDPLRADARGNDLRHELRAYARARVDPRLSLRARADAARLSRSLHRLQAPALDLTPRNDGRAEVTHLPPTWTQMFRSGFVEVLGLRMHVREAGAGEPVLLLHGLGVSGRYFMPLACVLAARRHVIVPDLPGWGKARDRRGRWGSAARPTCLPDSSTGAVKTQWRSLRTRSAARLPSCLRSAAPSWSGGSPSLVRRSIRATGHGRFMLFAWLSTRCANRPLCGASCSPTMRAWAFDGSPQRRRRHSKIVLRTSSQAFGGRSWCAG